MQKCKGCGKDIKFIAISGNTSVTCDAEELTVYTMNGRKVIGYKKHVCEGVNDGHKKD